MGGMEQVQKHARSQFGVVSRAQLIEAGWCRSSIAWKVKRGELERVHELVFRIGGAPASWQRTAMEGLLLGGEGSMLSHDTAAWLHGLDGFDEPSIIDVARVGAPPRAIPGLRFHTLRQGSPGPVLKDNWPIARVERTLVDLAELLDEEALELALDSTHRRYKFAGAWLKDYFKQLKPQGTPGLARLIKLFNLRDGQVTDSPLEVKVLRKLRQLGLTPPDVPYVVRERDGTYVMRLDFAWATLKIALHVDSYRWHSQRARFDRDARQRSRLQALGWRNLIVTANTFADGSWLDDLRALLNQQGELPL